MSIDDTIFLFKVYLLKKFKPSNYNIGYDYINRYKLENILFDGVSYELGKENKIFEKEILSDLCKRISNLTFNEGFTESLSKEYLLKIYSLNEIDLNQIAESSQKYNFFSPFGINDFETFFITNQENHFKTRGSIRLSDFIHQKTYQNIYSIIKNPKFSEFEIEFLHSLIKDTYVYDDLLGVHYNIPLSAVIFGSKISENSIFLIFVNLLFFTDFNCAILYLEIENERNELSKISFIEKLIEQINYGSFVSVFNNAKTISRRFSPDPFCDIANFDFVNIAEMIYEKS
jgi:hypothetical protein